MAHFIDARRIIEALLFVSDEVLTASRLAEIVGVLALERCAVLQVRGWRDEDDVRSCALGDVGQALDKAAEIRARIHRESCEKTNHSHCRPIGPEFCVETRITRREFAGPIPSGEDVVLW